VLLQLFADPDELHNLGELGFWTVLP